VPTNFKACQLAASLWMVLNFGMSRIVGQTANEVAVCELSWVSAPRHEKHRVESRDYSLSVVRTERNNAALHAAEIAVASQRTAEIE
jgi:hypothetical protein